MRSCPDLAAACRGNCPYLRKKLGYRGVFQDDETPHLNLEKEVQLRDYDGMVAHTTIVMTRNIFLAIEQQCHDDQKTIGGLFFACSEEIRDMSLADALQRLLTLVLDKARSSGAFAEIIVIAMIDAIMGAAIEFIQPSRRLAKNTALNSICYINPES